MTTFTRGLRSSASDEWCTPKYLFDELNREFMFTVDAASTHENALVDRHWTIREDGLAQSWDGERVWCNPPYGRQISKWVKKASEAVGGVVVMLIPARTDTAYWHDYVFPNASDIRFIRGRLHFSGSKAGAPFPSAIVVFGDKDEANEVKR